MNTSAVFPTDFKNVRHRIAVSDILLTFIDIEVEIIQHIDLIDQYKVRYLKHQRILQRLVVSFRNRKNTHVSDGSRIELGRADQISDILRSDSTDRLTPLADDPAAIKHIADLVLVFAKGSFEYDVYEAAHDYLDYVVNQYPTY